jgi:hypothetical protein
MSMKKVLAATGVMLLGVVSGFAQDKPGTIASLEFQKPKNGMVKQYEEGRKTKAAWHKQQKDTQPLMVWQVISGEGTGTYIVGRLGQHWADLDKPSVPDQADLDEFTKVIGPAVESLTTQYYEYLPKDSKPLDSPTPSKYSEVIVYHARQGKGADFRAAITKTTEAIEKTKWPVHYYWYSLVNGGRTGTYVLVIPHPNWADFEDKPDMKPFPEMLKDAFGQADADALMKKFDDATESETTEINEFRADLSYLPAH